LLLENPIDTAALPIVLLMYANYVMPQRAVL